MLVSVEWQYQRMEFLGDAILKGMAGVWAFFHSPTSLEGGLSVEGSLSKFSTPLKSNSYLRQCCRNEGLQNYLWAGMFVARSNGRRSGLVTLGDLRRQTVSDKMQADIMEALIGAVYLSNYFDPRLFPTVSDADVLAVEVFPHEIPSSFKPPKPANHPPRMLAPVDDESLSEAMVKHAGQSKNRVKECQRLIGSSSGFYAAALFADAYLMDARKTPVDELRAPMAPFFEGMRRLSINVSPSYPEQESYQ